MVTLTATAAVESGHSIGALISPIQLVNLLLLVTTAILSARSFAFQARASVRESIEQLDDVEYQNANQRKVKALLHRFSFGWADFLTLGLIGNPESQILLKEYSAGTHGPWGSKTRYFERDFDKGGK